MILAVTLIRGVNILTVTANQNVFLYVLLFLNTALGLGFTKGEDTAPQLNSITIILEGNIVMDDIPTHCQAHCLLFGLICSLHLDDLKGMKNTNIKK